MCPAGRSELGTSRQARGRVVGGIRNTWSHTCEQEGSGVHLRDGRSPGPRDRLLRVSSSFSTGVLISKNVAISKLPLESHLPSCQTASQLWGARFLGSEVWELDKPGPIPAAGIHSGLPEGSGFNLSPFD